MHDAKKNSLILKLLVTNTCTYIAEPRNANSPLCGSPQGLHKLLMYILLEKATLEKRH